MSRASAAVDVTVLAGAYLVGSIPVAWMLGRRRDIELREVGSGNPGTSNLFRNAGVGAAALSGPLQFAQGAVPVLLARAVGAEDGVIELAAVCAVVGNGWPVWLRFNGQRCVAVASGAAAGLHPALLVVLLICFGAGALTHSIALGVLAGFSALPIVAAWLGGRGPALSCCGLLAAILLRRLEGLAGDLRAAGRGRQRGIVVRRLLLDERPGQVLVGRRTQPRA